MTSKVYRYLLPLSLLSIPSVLPSTALAQQSMCAPVSNNPLVMENLCNDAPRPEVVPAVQKMSASRPVQNLLMLTAHDINTMTLDDRPMIRLGDAWVFEANRSDFVLEIYLSNGKEIVVQPLTLADAQNTVVGWRKGRVKLDYAESLNEHMIGMRVTALHETAAPLMFRAVKIDRKGRFILELEKSQPGPRPRIPEPPMSYPPDPRVLTASVTRPSLFGQGGYIAPRIPAFTMPFLMQSANTGDPNHFKWNGKEFDAETGLYNFGARYYSPGVGRFVTPDPKVLSAQRMFDPQQWNMYAYARNNPLKYTDPDGKELALATGMSKADAQRVTKSLVEVYRKPGGAQRIERLAGSSIKYTVGSGDLNSRRRSTCNPHRDSLIDRGEPPATAEAAQIRFGKSEASGFNY
jgi:RHS repeat-associated protein